MLSWLTSGFSFCSVSSICRTACSVSLRRWWWQTVWSYLVNLDLWKSDSGLDGNMRLGIMAGLLLVSWLVGKRGQGHPTKRLTSVYFKRLVLSSWKCRMWSSLLLCLCSASIGRQACNKDRIVLGTSISCLWYSWASLSPLVSWSPHSLLLRQWLPWCKINKDQATQGC